MRTGRRDWLWGIALGMIAIAAALVVASLWAGGNDIKSYATVAGIDCQSGERLEYHKHASLALFVEGERIHLPPNVGVRDECLFWLHTHDDTGLIHIEAPGKQTFTLGQLMAIWGKPVSQTQLLDRVVDADHEIRASVNGENYHGDPASIELVDEAHIVVQYGPPFADPPPSLFE